MKTSEKTETLFAKLFEALHDMPAVEKNNTAGGNFKYKYADLDSVVNKSKPILQKCELSFIQSIGNVDGKQTLTTRLFHKSGEWIEDTTILPHAKLNGGNEAQEMGSSITYLRRYSLCAMLGIVSDDDTDGVPPSSKLPASYQQVKSEPRPKEATPDPDLKELGNILNSTNNGKPVFTEEEKQMYRDKVEKGEFKKKLIEDAKVQLQEKLTGGQKEQLPIF